MVWGPGSYLSSALGYVNDLYDAYLLPVLVDRVCSQPGFARKRKQVVPQAKGRVLEIGIGSGHNLPEYTWDQVTCVKGVDPSEKLVEKARRKAEQLGLPVEISIGSAEQLEFPDESFDSVVVGFSLCTIPNVSLALKEAKRVLKSGGMLLFTEHGLAPEEDQTVQAWQHRLTPYWKVFAGGCHLNRNIEQLILDAGFTFSKLDKKYIKGPKIASYLYYGKAARL